MSRGPDLSMLGPSHAPFDLIIYNPGLPFYTLLAIFNAFKGSMAKLLLRVFVSNEDHLPKSSKPPELSLL